MVTSLRDIARAGLGRLRQPRPRGAAPEAAMAADKPLAALPESGCEDRAAVLGQDLRGRVQPFPLPRFPLVAGGVRRRHRKTGWLGQHLVLDGADGRPAAILPAYLKSHSMGEYVFDHGWADAFERAGGRYYPKLQVSVPFTPVTGRRLLVRPGADADRQRALLAARASTLARRHGVSSLHVTFLPEDEWSFSARPAILQRTDQQFHFVNEGYRDFEDFLAALASRKRKAIRRERRDALAGGIEIVHLTGRDLTEAAWDAFFAFYMDTGSRKWGRPYLNRRFFSLLGERMGDRILLMLAKRGGTADRRRAQPHRLRHALRPLLGRGRGAAVPAFRALLLPGDRMGHRPRPAPRRGRRAGRAQARARLRADDDLLGPLDRRPVLPPRRRQLPRPGAPQVARDVDPGRPRCRVFWGEYTPFKRRGEAPEARDPQRSTHDRICSTAGHGALLYRNSREPPGKAATPCSGVAVSQRRALPRSF